MNLPGMPATLEKIMNLRAKFRVVSADVEAPGTDSAYVNVHLEAVTAETPENKEWSRWTPSGSLRMAITNPAAFEAFEVGREYFLDISPA